MLECQAKKVPTSDPIRFVGGGALSPVTSQILADVTGRTVQTVASPQNAGSVGAAAVMAVLKGTPVAMEPGGKDDPSRPRRHPAHRLGEKVPTSDPIRFVGGGALSPVTSQILADVTGRTVDP